MTDHTIPSAHFTPSHLDRATVTRRRNRKGGTSAKVTGQLLPDARLRMGLDRDADAILLAGALGFYESGTIPTVVTTARIDRLGRVRAARIGDVPEAPYSARHEITAEEHAEATELLVADGMSLDIPFRESFAEVTPSLTVSRKAWLALSVAERDERCRELGTECAVARHTADLTTYHGDGLDRSLLTATHERGRPDAKLRWFGPQTRNVARRGIKRGDVAETAEDGTMRLYGPDAADGRVWVGHELRTVKVSKRQGQRRSADVRSALLEACAAVLGDRASRRVTVAGVDVELVATSKRGRCGSHAGLYVAYRADGFAGTAATPAGAARAILARVAA